MEIPEFGKKVRRQVTVGGKKIAMRLELCIVEKYDERGNEIYRKYYECDGFYDGIVEDSMEYDKHNNRILEKKSYLSNGTERNWEREFDDRGNMIYSKDPYGYEEWYEYDERGNEIHSKDSYGNEAWSEYDDCGNEIHMKNSKGYEWWGEYDERGNLIHSKDPYGYERWYEYDDSGNEIHEKNAEGSDEWREYDERGNMIHCKHFDGHERWFEYDARGNEIHCRSSEGNEYWREYDERGNEILDRDSEGSLRWYEIEYDENGKKRIVLTFCKVYYGIFSVLRRVRRGISKRFKKFQKRQTHNARRESEKRLRKN